MPELEIQYAGTMSAGTLTIEGGKAALDTLIESILEATQDNGGSFELKGGNDLLKVKIVRNDKIKPKKRTKTRRMRNYGAMSDDKLRAAHAELLYENGAAYDKCIETGSGDPDKDFAHVEKLMIGRGLI